MSMIMPRAWVNPDGITGEADLITFSFLVSEDAEFNTTTAIEIKESPNGTSITDNSYRELNLVAENGVIEIVENFAPTLYDDVDCDGVVDGRDMTLLLQYLVGKAQLTDQGLANADCHLDGAIDVKDALALAQYLCDFVDMLPIDLQ